MSFAEDEIRSQPEVWRRAVAAAPAAAPALPPPGSRTLVFGCGTSAFVAHSMAALREQAGLGETDWAYASEAPIDRGYEQVVAVTRSGTTTEVLQALASCRGQRTVVTGDVEAAAEADAEHVVDLSFADERSVVQTRFPTSLLMLWRAFVGESGLDRVVADGERALSASLPVDPADFEHFVFLGRGWTVGLAHEAALKMRESAQAWSESHPALDYRHGPIAAAGPRSLIVSMGGVGDDLLGEVRATGATALDLDLDPLARLVVCQRLAVAAGAARGLDVDHPRHLTRSVILEP